MNIAKNKFIFYGAGVLAAGEERRPRILRQWVSSKEVQRVKEPAGTQLCIHSSSCPQAWAFSARRDMHVVQSHGMAALRMAARF